MKRDTRNANWKSMSAFGDHKKYKSAASENNRPSPGKKQNNHAGVIGKAGLILATNSDPDRLKTYHKKNKE